MNVNKEDFIAGIRRGRGKVERVKDKYRINKDVRAAEVRLIDEEGTMLGVMSSDEAFQIAQGRNLDLIEVAPGAKPPTCKIMDYGKWKYENKKKEKQSRKKQTVIVVKEIQIRPRTEDHDLNFKLKKAIDFLLEGNKVKVNLRFSGREMAHQNLGLKLLEEVNKKLSVVATVEAPPKKEGRQMFALLAPDAAKIKEYKKTMTSSAVQVATPTEKSAATEVEANETEIIAKSSVVTDSSSEKQQA